MDTTAQTQNNNNLSQFWATAQTSIPITSSSLGVSPIFYGANSLTKQPEHSLPQTQQLIQTLSSTNINTEKFEQKQQHLNVLDHSTSVFHSLQQSHVSPQALIPSTFSNIQQTSFRSPIVGANPASFDATVNAARFAQHLLPTSATQLPSFVNFDCMGLMNNFGLTTGQSSVHSQQCNTNFSATPFISTAETLQSTSAAFMPFAMNSIYVNGDDSSNSGIGINNSSFIQKPTPQVHTQPSVNVLVNNQQIDSTTQLHLMDLSSRTVLNRSNDNMSKGNLSIVSNDVSSTNINEFIHPQLTTSTIKNENESIGQQSAFCTFTGGKIKQEIASIPKETATIPLESSHEASYSSSSEQRPQTQLSCQVCHLAASNGLHFGARTCAACAAFFRRSISDQKRYICKRSQRCVIRPSDSGTQGYRKICRDCRMKRCLDIGMLPENVQNKRNKRDYFFADALTNVIQQKDIEQSMDEINKNNNQRQIQSITRAEIDKILGPHFNKFTEFNETQSLTALTQQQSLLTSTLINDNAKSSLSDAFNLSQIKHSNIGPLYSGSVINPNERLQRIAAWNE